MSLTAYKKARKKLAEMGWITHKEGEYITVNYDVIYGGKGDTENTPSKETQKIKGDTENTPLGMSENTPSGDTENTHNNISNNINKYDNITSASNEALVENNPEVEK